MSAYERDQKYPSGAGGDFSSNNPGGGLSASHDTAPEGGPVGIPSGLGKPDGGPFGTPGVVPFGKVARGHDTGGIDTTNQAQRGYGEDFPDQPQQQPAGGYGGGSGDRTEGGGAFSGEGAGDGGVSTGDQYPSSGGYGDSREGPAGKGY